MKSSIPSWTLIFFCNFGVCWLLPLHTRYLEQGESVTFQPEHEPTNRRFQIYCYQGRPKFVIHIWQSVLLQIDSRNNDFDQYEGSTPEEVKNEFDEHRSSWSLNLFSWKQKQIKLNPFNQSCIGIYSDKSYTVTLHIIRIDYWKVLYLTGGILLFLSAERLSKNAMFHYLCGISFGVAASFLILIYFISRLIPRKSMMYGAVAAGWTLGVYIGRLLWDNFRLILLSYKMYVGYYALCTGVLSFLACYRWGPVENERTKTLIKWALQLLGLLSIFFSSQFQEASMGQIVILLIAYNLPKGWLSKPKQYWKKRFPPKVQLLSLDEYHQQGVRETVKALEELKEYCSSPTCNQWNTALKLKDVKRFASFMEGSSHLSDEEILLYETSFNPIETDDEDDEEEAEDEDLFTD